MTSYLYYVVLTQPNCAYCTKAADLLQQKDLPYTKIDISRTSWIKTLVKQADLKTVPQIYGYNGEYIGGYEDLEAHLGAK